MEWLVIAGVVLVALIAVPLVVGALLPPPFEFRVERDLSHPPEAVWAALHDYRAVPTSGRQCRGSEPIAAENGLPAWRENMGPSVATFETIESEEPVRVVRHFSDSVVPMTMRCEYTIAPAGEGGSRIAVAASGAIESGTWHVPLFRFFVKVLGLARKGQRDYLDAVATHLDRT